MSSGNKRVKSLDLPKSKIQENSNPGSYEKGFHIAKSVPILLSKLEIDDIPGWNAKVKDYFVCIRFIFSDWRGYCTCPDTIFLSLSDLLLLMFFLRFGHGNGFFLIQLDIVMSFIPLLEFGTINVNDTSLY